MAEPSSDSVVVRTIGPLITTVIGAAIGWLPGGLTGAIGSPLTVLLASAGGISGLAFSLMYKRYIGVLGAGGGRKGYPARDAYERLRASLSSGNLASRLYADWLTKFLDAVDRFFGDAGLADQTLFPHAFGLKTPAPLWTAPAFDRCLLLALIYPIVTIFIIWAVSGHVGPAEAALGFKPDISGWRRALAVGLPGVSGVIFLWAAARWAAKSTMWGLASAFVLSVALFLALDLALGSALGGAAAVSFVVIIAGAFVLFGVGYGVLAVGAAVALASVGSGAAVNIGPLSLAGVVAIITVVVWRAIVTQERRQGVLLVLHFLAMIIACFGAAIWLPHFEGWNVGGPMLLFIGLLTLINAPFDWASLGLTRALLRRGLELGGWWPYVLALADALAAAFIIALLAITMVISVQTFGHLADQPGIVSGVMPWDRLLYSIDHSLGRLGVLVIVGDVLPLDKLFDGIAAQPSAPEYWWVYALLFSTMIPSLLNLMIGGASLLRGIPGLPALLLRFMPAGKAVPAFDRTWLALVLTCQVFIGAFLGIAAQFVLAIGVIFYVLPWMGLELLETARVVAEFDLPGRVLGLLWGNQ